MNFRDLIILICMNETLKELEKLLNKEAPNPSPEKYLRDIEREAFKLQKLLQNLAAKIAAFDSDESLSNNIKTRIWEIIRERTGISKTIAKFLRDKHLLVKETNGQLKENEKITPKEFFELDCLLGSLSRRNIPTKNLPPDEKAQLILLARKHQKNIPSLVNKMKL